MVQEGPPGPVPTGIHQYHRRQHDNEKGPPPGNGATITESEAAGGSKTPFVIGGELGWITIGTAQKLS
eukprot:1459726-Karenia_brevis.AAC.1